MQELRGSGRGCGDIVFERAHSAIQRQQKNNVTKTRLLEHCRGSELDLDQGILEIKGVSGVRVGTIYLHRWIHSPVVGILMWRLKYFFTLKREFCMEDESRALFFPQIFWKSFGMNLRFYIENGKALPFNFVFFKSIFIFFFLVCPFSVKFKIEFSTCVRKQPKRFFADGETDREKKAIWRNKPKNIASLWLKWYKPGWLPNITAYSRLGWPSLRMVKHHSIPLIYSKPDTCIQQYSSI